MISYLLRRIFLLIPTLLVVSFLTFGILEWIPGDPALAILGPMATEESVESLRDELNLSEPFWKRYGHWLGNLIQGDFGRSLSIEKSVGEELKERLTATFILAGSSFFICLILGVGLGAWLGLNRGNRIDQLGSTLIISGVSMPSFWLGLLMVLLCSVFLKAFPVSGMQSVFSNGGLGDLLYHLWLPTLTLSLVVSSLVARIMRAKIIEVMNTDFIRTAKSKGMSQSRYLLKHAIPNALVPIIPILGLQAGYLIGGAVYVEVIFQWPGIGQMLVQAIQARDIVLVQAGVITVAFCFIILNLIADVLQVVLDPRLRDT